MRVVQILGLVAQFAMMVRGSSGPCTTQIDPNSVYAATRSQWCSAQINTCGTLCSGNSDTNTCDPTTLCYDCTCSSNSSSPALQYYTQTIPTYICEQKYTNCIYAAENDAAAQRQCAIDEQANCGHIDPDSINFPTATSTSSSSSSYISASSTYVSNKSTSSTSSSISISISTLTETNTNTKTNANTAAPITSTTKTITPIPAGTTTVWSTSTAGLGSNVTTGGSATIGSETAGNFSTLPGIPDISSKTKASTLPGITDVSMSTTGTGTETGVLRPSTVSVSGAGKIVGLALGGVWGVLVGGVCLFWGLGL
ncbi:hypothetical protein EAF04_007249 [Stromatinia cepivora]|nr:hypothetical protein EAF04_007249 [Stromatinia cepivora]